MLPRASKACPAAAPWRRHATTIALNENDFYARPLWPDACSPRRCECHEVTIVPSVESQTSAIASTLNARPRRSILSPAHATASNRFSTLLEDPSRPKSEPASPRTRRSDREVHVDERTATTAGSASAQTSEAPVEPASPPEPAAVSAAPDIRDRSPLPADETTPPAEPPPAPETEVSAAVDNSVPPTTSVAVPPPTAVPTPVPAAPAVLAETAASGDGQTLEETAAAVAPAVGRPAASTPVSAEGEAGADGGEAGSPSRVPAGTVTLPSETTGEQASTAAASAAGRRATPGPTESLPGADGDHADEPQATVRGAASVAPPGAETARSKSVEIDAATPTVDAGPRTNSYSASHIGLEPLSAVGTTEPAGTTVAAAAPAKSAQSPAAAVPVSAIAVEIVTRAQAGHNRFEIRLDPPELGRIDVKLDVDRHGNVTSHLVVERSETLDLLRREAPQLERTLNDAGLKTGDSALQFSLRDQGASAERDARSGRQPSLPDTTVPAEETVPREAVRNYRWTGTAGGIDIRV